MEFLSEIWMKKRLIFSPAVNSRLDPELTITAIISLDKEYRPTRAAHSYREAAGPLFSATHRPSRCH
jgi:hypothetical protein